MDKNSDGVCDVARYATRLGVEVFYQPINQNYNMERTIRIGFA